MRRSKRLWDKLLVRCMFRRNQLNSWRSSAGGLLNAPSKLTPLRPLPLIDYPRLPADCHQNAEHRIDLKRYSCHRVGFEFNRWLEF